MAIDTNETIRTSSVRRDDTIVTFRIGLDDRSGEVIVEDDGVIRPATEREAEHYAQTNATEAKQAADRITNSGISTVLGLLNYLKAKFPEDFE